MTDGENEPLFGRLVKANDYAGLDRLLVAQPELLSSPEQGAFLIHWAASNGNTELVALLVRHGVDVNAPRAAEVPDRPISSACMGGHAETVRWLIEHGSDVNYGWGGEEPYCVPIAPAIEDGRLDLVRLLVEAGARLDALDRRNKTPLSWAIAYRRAEIEAYLRSKGAVESEEAPGYGAPPPPDPLVEAVEDAFCVSERLAWVPGPVAARAVWGDGVGFLFTRGVCDHPLPAPAEGEAFPHAELMFYVGEWGGGADVNAWRAPECRWAVDWMVRLAGTACEGGLTGGRVAVVANGEPPRPLSPHTRMTCWLLLAGKEPLSHVDLPDGRRVTFYNMIPIYTAERDFEREHGWEELLRRFAERDVPESMDGDRPCAV